MWDATRLRALARRIALPSAIFVLCATVYVITLGERRSHPAQAGRHFVYLADSLLHGQLSLAAARPPTDNDWALYEGKWYVSFPPFPAVLLVPAVAIWGVDVKDALLWGILAGLAPALLYVLLRFLREKGRSERKVHEDLALTALFAFGSVYFFSSVQGDVWFAAHVVASCLLALYALWSIDARRPVLAGTALALAFVTRPTLALVGWTFFAIEALRVSRRADAPEADPNALVWKRIWVWLRGVRIANAAKLAALFAAPVLVVGGLAMWLNDARFGDPFDFGHAHLQIRWRPRIEKWGLFNYHYLAKNLAVFVAGLPWLTSTSPYLKISGHGLALWVTTPNYLLTLWPKRVTPTMIAMYVAVALIALYNLAYQNSGWLQFGYRFSLDYAVLLIALLAMGGRRFGPGFYAMLVLAIVINTFGAVTFYRAWEFYDNDMSQNVMFHPD